ncbi:MAG: undecaprenyldiphospho-muramoylpentapeptide beta-N-acetylglucosaminyltransferase [Bacteroidales bacterium]|jgi:UDP-N-acetylglucosamine--N-acetylmuramyl-(pentapeptide) pyrophosphoryl-undecaprenol N-acetylglucosamine transferase|nr:undecaprenyldiphospho-muramoylpentapeptide beta-N-acetylglucosaminyltransferase [Bacteroidales bacterium]
MNGEKRIIISGGGTGGHIFPAISIANEIRKRDPQAEILFVGALGKMEMERVPKAGYNIEGLPVAGLKRKLSFSNLLLPYKVIKSLKMAGRILDKFKPHIVIGVGGYASAPLLWMAGRRGLPYIIQEQNSYAGLANRILSKRASVICTAYEGMGKFFPEDKILVSGNPVRDGIQLTTPILKREGKAHFGIPEDKRVLLVTGGSLGARTLNNAVQDWIKSHNSCNFSIIWQTGKFYKEEIDNFIALNQRDYVKHFAFLDRMDLAIAAADVIVTRAGAGTISELSIAGKACIFVPSPMVAEDHQTHNAMTLVKRGAAMMIKDSEAGEFLMQTAADLVEDKLRIEELEEKIKQMAYSDAASIIVNELYKLIRREK